MFIKPAELARTLNRHGLHLGEIVGLGPRAKLPTVLRSFISVSKGRITYGEFSRRVDFGRIKSTAASYMGYATKAAATDLRGATPPHLGGGPRDRLATHGLGVSTAR
jgi:2-polyprenyl-6-hydroxyphenyl methylase/3-demethylubiquinone-9 3-methyltransferase